VKETITVYTGEIKTSDGTAHLKSSPLGSCVVVVLFDGISKTGGMAHIMLPGKAPEKQDAIPGRYAENAIDMLIRELTGKGMDVEKLKAAVVGGGNVLKRDNDTIGTDNLDSVSRQLQKHNIEIVAVSVKGTERKTVRFDTELGIVFYTKGDAPERELYRINKKPKRLIESSYE
jgi:chemotaxis protein CheD